MWLLITVLMAFFAVHENDKQSVNSKAKVELKHSFNKGEFLRYNIHYGLVNAGEATFTVLDTQLVIAKKPHYHLKVTGRTYKTWDYFYKVRDVYHSYIDSSTLKPTIYSRTIKEGDYIDDETYFFNLNDKKAIGKTKGEEKEVEIPEDIFDLVSMIYYSRCINFRDVEEGFELPLNVFFASEWFASGAKYVGKEIIKTKLGTFRCLKVVPQLIEGRVFKGQNDMVVYVSDDKNQVPIRIESEIFVGSIKVDLEEYKNLKYPFECKIK